MHIMIHLILEPYHGILLLFITDALARLGLCREVAVRLRLRGLPLRCLRFP